MQKKTIHHLLIHHHLLIIMYLDSDYLFQLPLSHFMPDSLLWL
jgi:hypothetical protein